MGHIRITGALAKLNPFRFSTKYQDDETDLLYYGYRYYNASTGRWLSRDPMEEMGGLNLYNACGNDLINEFDPYGLWKYIFEIVRGAKGEWGDPKNYFTDSTGSYDVLSATTKIIGKGPGGYCCNTPATNSADNDDAGTIIVYLTDVDKGVYAVNMYFSGSASINTSMYDSNDQFSHAGAILKFTAEGRGEVLHGDVIAPGNNPKLNWAGSQSAVAVVMVKDKSDRVEIGRYNIQMGLDACKGVTVTAEGKIKMGGFKKLRLKNKTVASI